MFFFLFFPCADRCWCVEAKLFPIVVAIFFKFWFSTLAISVQAENQFFAAPNCVKSLEHRLQKSFGGFAIENVATAGATRWLCDAACGFATSSLCDGAENLYLSSFKLLPYRSADIKVKRILNHCFCMVPWILANLFASGIEIWNVE